MYMGEFDEKYIKSTLQRRTDRKNAFARKRKNIMDSLLYLDDIEESIIMPSHWNENPGVQKASSSDGMFHTFEKLQESDIYSERNTYLNQLKKLNEDENRLKRIIICYQLICTIMPLHYLVIDKLWYSGHSKVAVVANELRKGPNTVQKMIDYSIVVIKLLAESDFNNMELSVMGPVELENFIGDSILAQIMKNERDDRTVD